MIKYTEWCTYMIYIYIINIIYIIYIYTIFYNKLEHHGLCYLQRVPEQIPNGTKQRQNKKNHSKRTPRYYQLKYHRNQNATLKDTNFKRKYEP